MSNFEVKVVIREDLSVANKKIIENRVLQIAQETNMKTYDGITYSRKLPYKELEDIPSGFMFYNKLRKFKNYFSLLEYYSYLEGDMNGKIIR